jgi:poly-gamma-glutamate synthesis protein (capsule biosynthesis protein)
MGCRPLLRAGAVRPTKIFDCVVNGQHGLSQLRQVTRQSSLRTGDRMATNNSRAMSVLAAGSAMYTRRVSACTDEKFLEVVKLIRDADVSFMNMEGHIGDPEAYPLKPYSFASYYAGDPWVAEEYKWTGFNLAALANNHATDWSPASLYTTQRLLDEAGIVHAGTGKNLTAAREPGYLDTPKGRVALISIDSSHEQGEFVQPSMASDPRGAVPGRPGVNVIRYNVHIDVDEETLADLKRIRKKLNLEAFRGREADSDDSLFFCNGGNPGMTFRLGEEHGYHTVPVAKDLEANLHWVRNAKEMADYVFVTHHTHANGNHETGPCGILQGQAHSLRYGLVFVDGRNPSALSRRCLRRMGSGRQCVTRRSGQRPPGGRVRHLVIMERRGALRVHAG